MNDPQQWKGVLSVLANDNLRLAAAELIVEEAARSGRSLTEGQRRKARDRLVKSGLFRSENEAFNSSFLKDILDSAREPGGATGVERFLAKGRIETFPTRARHRDEVLAWACSKVISGGEVLSEKAINERLKEIADDYVLLRRYLVDGGWLVRTASGSEYSLAPTPPGDQD
ncbi:DUF2087 domain-containing protein [Arthrobacter sp.]|uniref:DUF2087 domain-containing protein n=1 Tax=Arthrobacter sp. TaxID=1667 RepID=UPI002810D008|nr:DUF2087 domain-containing protein [Arthrobacter sp.]